MDKVQKSIDALERKLIKANKIAAKGDKMKLGDAIKLGRKSSSMAATINKGLKEYDASLVKRNLIKTAEASDELSKLMVSKAPAELKAQGEALAQRRNRAFDRALAVYANASGGDDLADGGEDSD